MAGGPIIQTNDLTATFEALRNQDPAKLLKKVIPYSADYKPIPSQNYAPTTSVSGAFGSGNYRFASASANSGMIYGQPQFFSPVHTPINWQIPSKRLEQYQWNYLPNTQVLTEDYTYETLENAEFICNDIVDDPVTGGFIFEAENYPKIMNSEGTFNQPPRMSMRDCKDKRCFGFKPIGNHRTLRISEEHYIFVLDGKALRKNKKTILDKKYRLAKNIKPNGVEKVKIQNKLVKRIQAQEVKRKDYLLTPTPNVGNKGIDKGLAWLIGFCIADGFIWSHKKHGSYVVGFTGCKDELALSRCKELLECNFDGTISSKQHGDGNGWRVSATTKEAYVFFRQYIENKGLAKKFSKLVFELDKETRLNILAGYFDGDGCLEKPCGKNGGGRLIANCYSIDLADQIYWLLISCGITCSIGKYPLYGDHYETTADCCYRILVPSSQVLSISKHMIGDKVPSNFIPKKERELKFFYEENGVKYLASPIEKIEEFLYTGKGFDIEMTNDRHALVADGYVCSNSRFFYENEPKVASSIDFYSCFEPNMQVLMADGTQKAIAEIKIGDIVRSHDGSANAVTNKFERHAVEEMLKLKIAGLSIGSLRCTKDHKILTEINGKIDFIKAGDLKEGDFLLTPIGYESNSTIDNDLAWLLGAYAAEGCGIPYEHESKDGKIVSKFKGVYFSLSYEEGETFAQTIKQKLHKLYGTNNVSITLDLEHNVCRVAAYGEDIADDLCGLCPGMSKNGSKRFSPLVMQLNNENLKHILAGFVTGDGCFNKSNGFQGVGVSKKLCEQIANICDKLGIEYSFTKTRLSKTDRQTCYNVRISRRACDLFDGISYKYYKNTVQEDNIRNTPYFKKGNFIYRKVYKIKTYQYDGLVYDLEISGVHTYVVNRISVHNCFPMNGFDNECKDRVIKKYFDKMCERLDIEKWLRLISHEVHLLGDCFPFIEIGCEHCGGSGKIGDQLCEHEDGTVRRIVILNPDYVDVYTSPINPVPVIALKPDEELINMVQKKTPGFERLTPEVRALVSSGKPIPLDNRNIFHIKYGEGGYTRYGVGMVRRLFPILSYKTKLMVAQWIVAERLIVPIRVVKVGSDERPAGPADIAAVQQQLAQTANDPNLTIVTHNAFEIDFIGASGKVLTLSNEFEFINQEILDGMMINNALLNGEGPTFSNAAVGIEAMIERLQTFRREISNWIEQKIYLPEAKRQGFIDKDADSEEEEYIYPKIKWHSMHLRDQQQHRTFVLQLYEKGLLSAQTVLETFDFDPDQEIERKRYDAVQMMALGQGMGEMGMGQPGGAGGAGGAPGGEMGGGFGGMPPMPGGGGEAGGGLPGLGGDAGGGAPPISAPGGGGAPSMATSKTSFAANTTDVADPSNYGGKVLKERTRQRVDMHKQKMFKQREMATEKSADGKDIDPWDMPGMRDAKGRIVFTKPERELMERLSQYRKNGLIQYPIMPQHVVAFGSTEYPIDFAIPHLKLGIEADGEIFHSSPKQLTHDKERDMKLAQAGWTILRFKDSEIDKQLERVMSTIMKSIMQKESLIQSQKIEPK